MFETPYNGINDMFLWCDLVRKVKREKEEERKRGREEEKREEEEKRKERKREEREECVRKQILSKKNTHTTSPTKKIKLTCDACGI